MAMGQCTSPNGPESAVLAGLVYQICELYIDDVLIHGRDLESFLYIVLKVFEMSQVNQAKIKLRLAEVEYVGHVISATVITFMEEKWLKKYKGSGKLVWSLRVLSASNQELHFFEDTATPLLPTDASDYGISDYAFMEGSCGPLLQQGTVREKECYGIFYGVRLFENLQDYRPSSSRQVTRNLTTKHRLNETSVHTMNYA